MPIFRHESPYYTPLSLPAWHIVTGTLFSSYRFLRWFNRSVLHRYRASCRFQGLDESCHKSLQQGMQKTAEETALQSPSEIDTRAFMWTFDSLDEDHELERFFSGLPGFRSSNVVDDPLPKLIEEESWRLYRALGGLLDRTFSFNLLPASVKDRRAMICAKVVDPEHTPDVIYDIFDQILITYQHGGAVANVIAKALQGWGNKAIRRTALLTVYSAIISSQPRDDPWYNVASAELGIPETSLRHYAAHGDSLSLVILIHFVCKVFANLRERTLPKRTEKDLLRLLATASKFNVKDTSPGLQHIFCALWNKIVKEAQDENDWMIAKPMVFLTLGPSRNVYLALHEDTDSAPTRFSACTGDWDGILDEPSSYPLCKVPGHHADSTDISMILARAIPHDHNNTVFVSTGMLLFSGPQLDLTFSSISFVYSSTSC